LHGYKNVNQLSPRLNVSLTYQPNEKQQIVFMCTVANTFPQIYAVNNVNQNIDILQIKRGNPSLKKTDSYNPYLIYSIQGRKFRIQTLGLYMFNNHQNIEDYYIEGNKLINSYRSDERYQFLSTIVMASYKINNCLNVKMDGRWQRTILEGATTATRSSWLGTVEMNCYWKDFAFNVYGTSTQKTLDMYSLIYSNMPVTYGLSAMWNHRGWIIDADLESPFTKRGSHHSYLDAGAYSFNRTEYSKINQQYASLKIAYNFDFGYKTNKENKNIDTNISNALLKI